MKIFISFIAIVSLLLPVTPQMACHGKDNCCHSTLNINFSNTNFLQRNNARTKTASSCCANNFTKRYDSDKNAFGFTDKHRCNCSISQDTHATLVEPYIYNGSFEYDQVLIKPTDSDIFSNEPTPQMLYARGNEPPGIHISISTTILRL